ncbi:MAG: MFS transporter [Lachnospiraceae bacterium]|nr:MFS transporter [Lachnospiraceae bacterium]
MSKPAKPKRDILWSRGYLLLSVSNFFAWLSYNMVTPVLTGYMETLGATLTVCGIVGGLFAFTSLLSRPISGVLADRLNRKWLAGGFTLIMTLSLLIYAVVPSVPMIMIFRGLHGIAFGISSTAGLVLVTESAAESRMGEAISYYSVMSVASMAIGPGLGIWVSDLFGHQACMLAGTVLLALASGAILAFPYQRPEAETGRPETGRPGAETGRPEAGRQKAEAGCPEAQTGRQRGISRLVDVSLIDLSCMNASFTMLNGIVSTFLVTYAAQKSIEGVSIHFTLNAILLIALRILLARQMNTWPLRKSLFPAFITGILTLAVIGTANSLALLLVAACFKAVAQGLGQPVLQTEAMRSVPPARRGIASSTMYIGGDLGQAVGPMIGGAVADVTGYGNMFLLCILPLAIAFTAFLFSRRNRGQS